MSKYTGTKGDRQIAVGQYKATPDALTDGDYAEAQLDSQGNQKTMAAGALSKSIDSIAGYPAGATPTPLQASGLIASGAGVLSGCFVSAASGTPTIEIYDSTSATGTIQVYPFTPVAGTYYSFGKGAFSTGAYAVIGGTVSVTFYTYPTTV